LKSGVRPRDRRAGRLRRRRDRVSGVRRDGDHQGPARTLRWGNLAEFLPQFYSTQSAPIVNPKTGYVVGGNPYDGIVFPANGAALCGGGTHSSASRSAVHVALPRPSGWPCRETQRRVFQPRLGVSYAINSKTVVRGGVGAGGPRVTRRFGMVDSVPLRVFW
jgi:hypothetical protein